MSSRRRKGVRVGVLMSGGVDSSVAAWLLKKQGYDVVGITLQLWDYGSAGRRPKGERGCCDISQQMDARFVCSQLEVDHMVLDLRERFLEKVVHPFEQTYLSGQTPNPCVSCNTHLKWGAVIEKADMLECDYISTGHYAQIIHGKNGMRLEKGVDPLKDQSYALWEVAKSSLERTILPLGKWSKAQIREEAENMKLRTARKPDSQEVCFISDHYEQHLRDVHAKEVAEIGEGPILNQDGRKVGKHRGFFLFTIGQRRGLDISDGRGPYYVESVIPEKNTVVVGDRSSLMRTGLLAQNCNWISFDPPKEAERCTVKIRYNDPGVPAWVIPQTNGEVEIRFVTPKDSVTPGQSAVWYKGRAVWGGGIIRKPLKDQWPSKA